MINMEPLYFRITVDVKNPTPDRRNRDWQKQPVFATGQLFKLNGDRDRIYVEGWKGPNPFKYAIFTNGYVSKYGDTETFNAILSAPQESVEQNPSQWIKDKNVWSNEVLARFIKLGVVTKSQVEDIQRVLEVECQEEFEASK